VVGSPAFLPLCGGSLRSRSPGKTKLKLKGARIRCETRRCRFKIVAAAALRACVFAGSRWARRWTSGFFSSALTSLGSCRDGDPHGRYCRFRHREEPCWKMASRGTRDKKLSSGDRDDIAERAYDFALSYPGTFLGKGLKRPCEPRGFRMVPR